MLITSPNQTHQEGVVAGLESTGREHGFVSVVTARALKTSMRLPCYAILWPDTGLELSVDGKRITLSTATFLITNPGQMLEAAPGAGAESRLTMIGLSTQLLATAYQELRIVSRKLFRSDRRSPGCWPVTFHNDPRRHDSCVSPVVRRIQSASRLGVHDKQWLVGQLRILAERLLFDEHKRAAGRTGRGVRQGPLASRLTRVRDYIDTSYDQPLRLEQMAQVVYASPYHFLRMFKSTYGQTPHQYLIRRRLEASKDLLETTNLPIKEISERVGFQNANGFYKAFKRCYDCSPANFRQTNGLALR